MVDNGWLVVAGAAVGAISTGAVTLVQASWQDRGNSEQRQREDARRRRAELTQIYTRYQLAADRLENRIRELRGPDVGGDAFESAQNEYDEACQLVGLLAPSATVDVVLHQRRLFNEFARQALDGQYDHDRNRGRIGDAARPVLNAMRRDLGTV